jgi:hypothetical protein
MQSLGTQPKPTKGLIRNVCWLLPSGLPGLKLLQLLDIDHVHGLSMGKPEVLIIMLDIVRGLDKGPLLLIEGDLVDLPEVLEVLLGDVGQPEIVVLALELVVREVGGDGADVVLVDLPAVRVGDNEAAKGCRVELETISSRWEWLAGGDVPGSLRTIPPRTLSLTSASSSLVALSISMRIQRQMCEALENQCLISAHSGTAVGRMSQ